MKCTWWTLKCRVCIWSGALPEPKIAPTTVLFIEAHATLASGLSFESCESKFFVSMVTTHALVFFFFLLSLSGCTVSKEQQPDTAVVWQWEGLLFLLLLLLSDSSSLKRLQNCIIITSQKSFYLKKAALMLFLLSSDTRSLSLKGQEACGGLPLSYAHTVLKKVQRQTDVDLFTVPNVTANTLLGMFC